MPQIRWGILGCGNVTEVKSGPGFQKADGSALTAVMRRDAAQAEDYARRHGVPRWYADAQALIHDPEVDAVYIATPPAFHESYTLQVAAARKPVYVEKPMARTYDECQRMIGACRSAGVPLFVAYYRRAMPRFLKIKELILGGAIGTPRCVFIALCCALESGDRERDPARRPWRVRPELAGGGRLLDLASHQFDFADFVFGKVVEVSGQAANQAGVYDAEDLVAGHFRFQSGVLGVGQWCFTTYHPAWDDRCRIVGSEGEISFSFYGTEPPCLHTAQGVTEVPVETPEHVQQPLIQTAVDELLGKGRCPSTGETAARTTWVLDQLLESWRAGHPLQGVPGA